MMTSSAWTATKGNVKSVLDTVIGDLDAKSATLKSVALDGQQICSGWAIKSVDKLDILFVQHSVSSTFYKLNIK